ncbi:MAG: hypothetical protein JNK58_02185 [Phycisphaerae bacterium]|nr:hypothetical protein [Phycisphaerae bacterium]
MVFVVTHVTNRANRMCCPRAPDTLDSTFIAGDGSPVRDSNRILRNEVNKESGSLPSLIGGMLMTLRVLMTTCAVGTLAACGVFAQAQSSPPSGGTGVPLIWNPTGPEDANVNFSGLPIQRDKCYMFYEHLIGKYPRIRTDPATGRVWVDNEGIPQKTNWAAHIAKVRADVIRALPDPEWDGMGILDFESWHPNWELFSNERMKAMSRDWVRARFPTLTAAQVEQRAHEEFEAAAMDFMVGTIRECKALRPRATWGYYGFPYFYPQSQQEDFRPLFAEMDAFFPDVYAVDYSIPVGQAASPGQRVITNYSNGVASKIELAKTWSMGKPVYAVIWMRYSENNPIYTGQFVNELDLISMFRYSARAGAQGFVFWDVFRDPAIRDGYNSFFAGRGGATIRAMLNEINPPPPPPPAAASAAPPPITSNTTIRSNPVTAKLLKSLPPKVLTAVDVPPGR